MSDVENKKPHGEELRQESGLQKAGYTFCTQRRGVHLGRCHSPKEAKAALALKGGGASEGGGMEVPISLEAVQSYCNRV